jgi:hypothetical protein
MSNSNNGTWLVELCPDADDGGRALTVHSNDGAIPISESETVVSYGRPADGIAAAIVVEASMLAPVVLDDEESERIAVDLGAWLHEEVSR